MSSEHLASAQNLLKGNLAGAWDILSGAQGQYESLGIARRFGVAAAAYSLRDIGANGSRVVRVRRNSGLPAEEDFSANQVASGSLENFCNEVLTVGVAVEGGESASARPDSFTNATNSSFTATVTDAAGGYFPYLSDLNDVIVVSFDIVLTSGASPSLCTSNGVNTTQNRSNSITINSSGSYTKTLTCDQNGGTATHIRFADSDDGTFAVTNFTVVSHKKDGFVTTLYDQSGNGNDVTQTTTGSQPKIVDSGSQVKVDGIPSIKFDGTDDFLERATYTQGDLSQPSTAFAVAKLRVFVDDNQKIFDGHLSTKRNMIQLNTTGNGQFAAYAGTVRTTGEDADADQHLFESRFNGAASRLIIDGVIKNTGSQGAQAMEGINIGANHDSASNFWDGDIQEIIIYNSDLFNDRADLENDINNYYTIYS